MEVDSGMSTSGVDRFVSGIYRNRWDLIFSVSFRKYLLQILERCVVRQLGTPVYPSGSDSEDEPLPKSARRNETALKKQQSQSVSATVDNSIRKLTTEQRKFNMFSQSLNQG